VAEIAPAAPVAESGIATDSAAEVGKPAIRDAGLIIAAPPADTRYLVGDEATAALDDARALAAGGDARGAVAAYLRLQSSDQAKTAVAEVLALAKSLGAWQSVIDIAEILPPELVTDIARFAWGEALYTLGRDVDAIPVLAKIPNRSPLARTGALLLAQALLQTGDAPRATKLLDRLAVGTDDVATQARTLLGRSGS
jgi:hypothetical protein